ncbi:hypothetical protein [Leptodesmis sp.]|uniref:hypothetical protein n=1 Tax=Leptodesmis sp. TaxID=3100501 RepID=UPI00405356CC
MRDRLFALAHLQRHHLVLDLNAGSGLLTWEAVRQVPEGGVYAWVQNSADAAALTEQSAALPELSRPQILQSSLAELPSVLAAIAPGVHFDRVIGRNVLAHQLDPATILATLTDILQANLKSHQTAASPQFVLAEAVLSRAQRLYQLLPADSLSGELFQRWRQAEEAIYAQILPPEITWDIPDLQTLFQTAGLSVTIDQTSLPSELVITAALLDRWFTPGLSQHPSYADHLSHQLSQDEISTIRSCFLHYVNQTVTWNSTIAFISGGCSFS